jgi:hypothetical protein
MPSNAQQRLAFTRHDAFPERASPFPKFRLPRAEQAAPADVALGKFLEVVRGRDAAEMLGLETGQHDLCPPPHFCSTRHLWV